MEQKIELKTFIPTPGVKAVVLQITDIMLHSTAVPPTQDPGKKVKVSFERNIPGRVYSSISKEINPLGNFMDQLKQDPVFMKTVQDYQNQGYKVLLQMPKEGVPVILGKDTTEFLQGKNGQRFLRGVVKKKTGV